MIFELSDDFTGWSSIDDWNTYLPAIENLINSHLQGAHYFIPQRSVAETLSTFGCVSARQLAVLQYDILARYSTLVATARTVSFTILLVPEGVRRTPQQANQKVMPLLSAAQPLTCREARILVENRESDGGFWERMVSVLAEEANFVSFGPLYFEGGGGATMAETYRQKIVEQIPTLCIADSDCEYPGGPLGATAFDVNRLIGTEPIPTIAAHILGVREIENFVPVKVARDIYASNPGVQQALDFYERLERFSREPHCAIGQEYNRFVDMKLGLRRSVVRRHEHTGAQFFRQLWQASAPSETEFDLEGPETIFPGISTNLIRGTIAFLGTPANRARMRARVKDLVFFSELLAIVELILAFSAAPPRQRV